MSNSMQSVGTGGLWYAPSAVGAPDAPSIVVLSIANGQATLSIIADDETDTISIYKRLSTVSAWTLAGTRTGSGNYTATGLTNGLKYAFITVASRSSYSLPSNEVSTTPSGAVTPVVVFAYNANWARWIFASVSKHFNDLKGTYTLYIEGQYRDHERAEDLFELRMDGPWAIKSDAMSWYVHCTVDLLVQSNMNDTNFHRIHEMVGYGASMFTTIQLYKYGTGVDDDQSHFGCLKLDMSSRERKRLKTSHFGQIRPSMRLMQSSVEGIYETYLTE